MPLYLLANEFLHNEEMEFLFIAFKMYLMIFHSFFSFRFRSCRWLLGFVVQTNGGGGPIQRFVPIIQIHNRLMMGMVVVGLAWLRFNKIEIESICNKRV